MIDRLIIISCQLLKIILFKKYVEIIIIISIIMQYIQNIPQNNQEYNQSHNMKKQKES